MQKQLLLVFFIAMIILPASFAQDPDFENFKRQQDEHFNQFVAERDSVIKQLNKDFEDYVEQRNREYAQYLENEWERMEAFMAAMPDPGPKPDTIPAWNPDHEDPQHKQQREEREKIVIRTIPPAEGRIQPRKQFYEPITVRPVDAAQPASSTLSINFYGLQIDLQADRSFRGIRAYGIDEKNVSEWFERAAQTNFAPTLTNLLDVADEMGMNDWALFMAASKLGDRLASNNTVGAKLYTWFLLLQAGYDIRLARQNDQLHFLMPFSHTVYNTPRLTIDNKIFYLLEGNSEDPLFTYSQTMPGAFRNFDMNFYKSPRFARKGQTKSLSISFKGRDYSLPMEYDPVLVAMLAEQPQADMNVYLDADASNIMVQAAQQTLEPILNEMSDVEKVSFLLHMGQTAFQYKTDIDQFGNQRYMIPDEVIHYQYSDCDDRAVLFAWLVRNFAGQKVAALLYPGHLATAVHFTHGNPAGDQILVDGLNFVVADPTFINAPIGLTMPDYINVPPTAWVIDAEKYYFEQSLALWQTLGQLGARRGNNQRDLVFAPDGDFYVTGYFTEKLTAPDNRTLLQGNENKRTAFVAAFTANMQPRWAYAFESEKDATGISLITDARGNLIVAGTFEDRLSLQNRNITSPGAQNDAFVAAFTTGGDLQWIRGAGLNNRHQNNAMAYSLHLKQDGNISKLHYHNDPRESVAALYTDADNSIILTGTFGNTSGLLVEKAPVVASRASMNYADMLIQRNRELIREKRIESSIAGLFAAIQLSKSEGAIFPGSAAQEALRKGNPLFPSTFPETFASIGKISFLRNKSGIIEIKTKNGDDVYFDKLRISNGSTVRIKTLPNGDEQIDILSDIHVGQAIVWYQLNFVRLYGRTGDLLFDYRRNNTQTTLNLKKDILN